LSAVYLTSSSILRYHHSGQNPAMSSSSTIGLTFSSSRSGKKGLPQAEQLASSTFVLQGRPRRVPSSSVKLIAPNSPYAL